MPQLEVSTYITQIFWLITTFLCFWLVMDKIVVPQIAKMIDARKRKYEDFIRKAEEINKKALDSLQHYEETLAVAKEKASKQIRENEIELKEFFITKEEEINQRLKVKISENENMLQREKDDTLKQIEKMSEEAAYNVLQQLNIKEITLNDIKRNSVEQ